MGKKLVDGLAGRQRQPIGQILQKREVSLAILLIALAMVLWGLTGSFATTGNVRVLLQGMTVDMIIAVPMAISLIAGNIDFSVGSTVALTSTVCGLALAAGFPAAGAVGVALLLGAFLGFVNAFIIEVLHVTSLVTTLGTWMAYKGLSLVVAGGRTIGDFPPSFTAIGRGEVFGVPLPVIYMVVVVVLGVLAMRYIPFFHNAYYIGSNPESARLAGINTKRFTYVSFVLTGTLAAFAGVVLAARLGAASQQAGDGLEFRNVVGLLIGGISMNGGIGTILGAVLGVGLMQMVNNAIVLLHLNVSYTKVITGTILVLAVAIDQVSQGRRRKRAAAPKNRQKTEAPPSGSTGTSGQAGPDGEQ